MNDGSIYQQRLAALEGDGLRRRLPDIDGPQGREIVVDGKRVLNFCSNDYLGLAADPRLAAAAASCLKEQGFGAGASRLVCGNLAAVRDLEQSIAAHKGAEDCVVFSTGYMANVGIITSLCGRDDDVLSDRLNHASILDGIRLSGARWKRYAHNDLTALETLLAEAPTGRRIFIITDTVFSMDGDVTPLPGIASLAARYNATVMVDEAHGFGVFGPTGGGVVEHFGLQGSIAVQMGTLSKAAGAFGAYCCGARDLIEYIRNRARSFIYTTGLPPSVAAAARCGVEIIAREADRRERLWDNTRFLSAALREQGFDTGHSVSPVIPIMVGDSAAAVAMSRDLFARGIFVSAIRPPTVPANTARLRVTVTAAHTRADLEYFLKQIRELRPAVVSE